ncbi:ABC transporter permease [Actinoplanes lobatus]|uniref:ABC transporter permease n=2 Tax=Actinoplanes lobatus TaxID=113568 RepID=A0ABQ4ASI5_9ACTN|nr:FtsX family ABC transporter permease [Actinoplanes lobatus]GGN90389.1 ABC transporter permease [Actinoplanes lobatus]GIE43800.1 ABC transporter permease [Actinoplanes lobatus]
MLAAANIREHWRSFLATFLAVVVGVGLIAATILLYDSGRPRPQPRVAGAPVLVVSDQARDQNGILRDRVPWSEDEARDLVQRLGAISGVEAAIIDRNFYAQAFENDEPVPDEATMEAGHGWSSTRLAPYELTSGRPPRSDTEVVVGTDQGKATGTPLAVGLTDDVHIYTVTGTIEGHGFYFTDAEAARRDTGVTTIGLLASAGASIESITDRAGSIVGDGGSALAGDARGVVEPAFVTHKRFLGAQLISAMAIMALFTTIFVVAATLALATAQRRREIGLLRTIGADPRQIRRMVLGEAVIVGLLGSIAGCLAGCLAAPAVLAILYRLDVVPPGSRVIISAWPLLTATVVGTGTAVLGAWAASRSASRVAPIEALLDAQTEQRPMGRGRRIGGLMTFGLGVVLAFVTAVGAADRRVNLAIATSMCLIAAAALLAPIIIGPAVRLVTAPFARRSSGAGSMLIRAELLNATRRAASTAAPVIVAIGFAVLISGLVDTMRQAYPAEITQQLAGQVLIDPGNAPGLNDAVVRENPDGRASLPTRLFLAREDNGTVIDGVGSRDPRWSKPGEAVLDTVMAEFLKVQAGSTVTVRFADGLGAQLRVAEVLPPDQARGSFVLSRETIREHDPTALTDNIFMTADQMPATLSAGARLQNAEQFALEEYNTDAELTDSLAMMLTVLAVGYSGLAVANSMAMAGYGRRNDFAVMRSTGGTRRQLLRFVIGETGLLVLIGSALGLLATLPPLAGVASGLGAETATPVSMHLDSGTLTWAVLGSLAIATAASASVTWNVLRPRTA